MEKEVEFLQEGYNFQQYCGMELKQDEDGAYYMVAPLKKEYMNPYGRVHGGYLATIGDIVGGVNAARVMPKPLTLSTNIEYYRNVSEGTLIGKAEIVKQGRKITVVRVRITCDDVLLAEATTTYFSSHNN